MTRREMIWNASGGVALAVATGRAELYAAKPADHEARARFRDLWKQACLSTQWFEDRRAYALCVQALAQAPKDLDSSTRAAIVERMGQLRESLAAAEEELPI